MTCTGVVGPLSIDSAWLSVLMRQALLLFDAIATAQLRPDGFSFWALSWPGESPNFWRPQGVVGCRHLMYSVYMGVSMAMGVPQNGWFLLGKIPSTNGWFGGIPILGNLHMEYLQCQHAWILQSPVNCYTGIRYGKHHSPCASGWLGVGYPFAAILTTPSRKQFRN